MKKKADYFKCNRLIYRLVLLIIFAVFCLSAVSANAEEWYQYEGKGYVVCDEILKRLNSYKSNTVEEAKSCSWDVVASYPGFKEPPWQELDPQKYKDLIFKLLKYRACGVDKYFGKGTCGYTDEGLRKEAERFIKGGGRIQLWRVRLLSWYEISENRPTPPGPQTVIQLRWKRDVQREQKSCPGRPVVDWWKGGLYIVADDLSGPDPRVKPSAASYLEYHTLFYFKGKLHYVSAGNDVLIGIDRDGWAVEFCNIPYK
ncbi:MAG: hypothetical protein A2Y65_00010 [Deltaproteobacteria bacterium RBG_13_52_11]|nr:MAG: hypothetical protein A2Y65_00010 [Deltaproteobacteria bacterium RBG_13_52_11]